MRYLPIFASALFIFGCAQTAPQSALKPKPNSAAIQQSLAEQAQNEMETDIKNGTVTLTEPQLPTTKPQQAPAPVPAPAPSAEPQSLLPIPHNTVNQVASLKPVTKYPLKDGYPVWFYNNFYGGYFGAVGIAAKQKSFSAQKKIAMMQAQKSLAQRANDLIYSETTVESVNVDTSTLKYYREKVSSMSREVADEYLSGSKILDEWIDPNTGEYYVWTALEK